MMGAHRSFQSHTPFFFQSQLINSRRSFLHYLYCLLLDCFSLLKTYVPVLRCLLSPSPLLALWP